MRAFKSELERLALLIYAMICELEHIHNYRLSWNSLIIFPNDVLCAQKGPALFHHSLLSSLDHHHHHQSSTFACIVLIRGTSCNNKAFYGGFFPLSLKTSLSWISRVTLHVFVKFNFSILAIALSTFFSSTISRNQHLQYWYHTVKYWYTWLSIRRYVKCCLLSKERMV